jgi:hypothetical protein
MRKIAPMPRNVALTSRLKPFAGIVVAGALLATPALAQNDFDLLLSELSFGEAQTPPDEPQPDDGGAEATSQQTAGDRADDTPQAAPTESAAPAPRTESTPQFGSVPPAPPAPAPLRNRGAQSRRESQAPASPPESEPVQAARPLRFNGSPAIPEPVRVPEPEAEASRADVDFEAVFAGHAGPHTDAVLRGGGDCGGRCGTHHGPALPPPSTFLQYFRSQPCYAGVWAGYQHEYQMRCQSREHLHGTCDCFKPKKKHKFFSFEHSPKLYRAGACSRCGNCDSGCRHTHGHH